MLHNGVTFGGLHSYWDFDLILSSVEIPPASPKETFIDIPGADGSVDMTEANGGVKYSDRTGAKFIFFMNPSGNLSDAAWEEKKTKVSNALNGLACPITLDKDPDYYWQGRCKIDELSSSKRLRKIVVGARLAPYKLKKDVTNVFVLFSGKNLFNKDNLSVLASNGCDLTATDTGVRADSNGGYLSVVKLLPVRLLYGKTITASSTITNSNCNAILRLGYASANGVNRNPKVSLYRTGSVSLTVDDESLAYDYVAVWFYTESGSAEKGSYVIYDDLQIEIGEIATAFEPYMPINPQEVTLTNARKDVCPEIVCAGEATLTVNGSEYVLSEGTHKVLDLQLHEGKTPVTVSGTGAIAFVYQEGDL